MTREEPTTDAVVLRSVDFRDADRILTLATRDLGRVSALARGARRSQKRFGSALGLFTVSRVELRRRAGAEMYTLTAATTQRAYLELAADVIALAHASYATELVRELGVPEQPEPEVFDLLVELYDTMSELGPSVSMLRAFELRLLSELGLAPVLDACIGCGVADDAELERGAVLDPVRGGVACARCAAHSRTIGVRPLSGAARSLLGAARAAPTLADAHDRGAEPPPAAREARDALVACIQTHLGGPLRSLEFLGKLSRENPGGS